MEKKSVGVILLILILVFSINLIYAGTKATIKTLQYHQVEVIVADGTITDYSKIGDYEGDANEYGDFTFNINTSKPLVNLYVHVKRYNEEIASETFIGEKTGSPIHLEVAPEGYELIETPLITANKTESNETLLINNTELLTNNESEKKSGLTGLTVSSVFSKKVIYFTVGIIVLLVVIFFIVRFLRKRKNGNKEIIIRKLSEMKQEREDKIGDYKEVIDDAERKIKEAQEEINKFKNQDKIKAMKRKLAEDEDELIKLRRGE